MNKLLSFRHLSWVPIFVALAGLAFASCNRLDISGAVINRSDTEQRVLDWLEWNELNGPVVLENIPDTYTFYVCSDVHLNDDNSRLAKFITTERNDLSAAFSIVAGDIANEKGERPYQLFDSAVLYRPTLQAQNDPCFPIIGNHDLYFDCATHYKTYCHTSIFSLPAGT